MTTFFLVTLFSSPPTLHCTARVKKDLFENFFFRSRGWVTRASVLIDTVYCHVCHVAGVGVVEGEAEAGEGELHLHPARPDTPHPRLPARRATLYLLSFTHSIQCHHLMRNHRCVRPGCHLQRERSTTCKIIVSFIVYFINYLDIILDANFDPDVEILGSFLLEWKFKDVEILYMPYDHVIILMLYSENLPN